MTRKFNIFFLV